MTFKKGNKKGKGWKMFFGKGKPKPVKKEVKEAKKEEKKK
jgi:hypothetical protein